MAISTLDFRAEVCLKTATYDHPLSEYEENRPHFIQTDEMEDGSLTYFFVRVSPFGSD
jgi:hypothetical protein